MISNFFKKTWWKLQLCQPPLQVTVFPGLQLPQAFILGQNKRAPHGHLQGGSSDIGCWICHEE